MRINVTLAVLAAVTSMSACAEMHPCYELSGAQLQTCEADVAARLAAAGSHGGGKSFTATEQERDRGRDGKLDAGEETTQGGGTTTGGNNAPPAVGGNN